MTPEGSWDHTLCLQMGKLRTGQCLEQLKAIAPQAAGPGLLLYLLWQRVGHDSKLQRHNTHGRVKGTGDPLTKVPPKSFSWTVSPEVVSLKTRAAHDQPPWFLDKKQLLRTTLYPGLYHADRWAMTVLHEATEFTG